MVEVQPPARKANFANGEFCSYFEVYEHIIIILPIYHKSNNLVSCKYLFELYNENMKIFTKLFSGNTLYYPGCMTKFALSDNVDKYKRILEYEGIEFIMLKDKELCCGSPVKNAGAEQMFKQVSERNLKVMNEHGVMRVISNCPSCVAIFKKDYPKLLGAEWKIDVAHISEVINRSKDLLMRVNNIKATYHDPCHLGRELGIYEKPREIIKEAGYELEEMSLSREGSFCCGGGGGVRTNEAELSNKIGQDRAMQAIKTQADVLVTACPMCYAQLKNSSNKSIKVLDLCDLFDLKLENKGG